MAKCGGDLAVLNHLIILSLKLHTTTDVSGVVGDQITNGQCSSSQQSLRPVQLPFNSYGPPAPPIHRLSPSTSVTVDLALPTITSPITDPCLNSTFEEAAAISTSLCSPQLSLQKMWVPGALLKFKCVYHHSCWRSSDACGSTSFCMCIRRAEIPN